VGLRFRSQWPEQRTRWSRRMLSTSPFHGKEPLGLKAEKDGYCCCSSGHMLAGELPYTS
jgi:hypothetical protein